MENLEGRKCIEVEEVGTLDSCMGEVYWYVPGKDVLDAPLTICAVRYEAA